MPRGFDSLAVQAAELGVALEPGQVQALQVYADELLRWNRAFNLISRQDVDRLVPRHLLDSLSVAPWLTGTRVLDLGTGAGLPGVPLAIAREDAQFTLIDLSERKIRFIRQVVRTLELSNVEPRCGDVRQLPEADVFDTVVCRAVKDPATVWQLASPRLHRDGRMIVMSRAAGSRAAEDDPVALPHGVLQARDQVRIPGLSQPHELMLLRHPRKAAEAQP